MNLVGKILRQLSLAAIVGSPLIGCSKDESQTQNKQDDKYESGLKESEDLVALAGKIKAPSTYVTQPATVAQPSVSTTVPSAPGTTSVTPNVPSTSDTAPTTNHPATPVSPGPVTIDKPGVPTVTDKDKPRFNRPANKSIEKKRGGYNYFSITDPQNFIALGGYGGDNRDSNLSGLDRAGGFALGSLDVRPFDWLRTELIGSYAREGFKRVGEDLVSDIGLARLGEELVLADNKGLYFGIGPIIGFNYISNKGTAGFEPTDFRAALAGGKLRTALRGIGLEAYLAGLQSVYGKYENDKFDVERDYFVRELRGGLKQSLSKGISVGAEASDIFQETKGLTRFSLRSASGYVELKDVFGSPVSAWIIGSGRELDAVDKQRAREVEAKVRLLANLGKGFYLGADGAYGRSKIRGSSKTEDNWSVGCLIAYEFK